MSVNPVFNNVGFWGKVLRIPYMLNCRPDKYIIYLCFAWSREVKILTNHKALKDMISIEMKT